MEDDLLQHLLKDKTLHLAMMLLKKPKTSGKDPLALYIMEAWKVKQSSGEMINETNSSSCMKTGLKTAGEF